jgi:hypothetical protein
VDLIKLVFVSKKRMDTAGSVFTGLTLASIITTGGLVINLTENFGNLANDGQVKQEVLGDKLVGPYGNAVTGMSAVVIGLSALYLVFFIYGWYRTRHSKEANIQRIMYTVMVLAMLLGICSAAVNLNLTENYLSISNLEPDPNPVVPGENYKLRGSYGTATLGMASASLAVASIAFLWMGGVSVYKWNMKSSTYEHSRMF